MRILVLFGLLLLGTAPVVGAQQRDTTTFRRDTVTRTAPAVPRDTLQLIVAVRFGS